MRLTPTLHKVLSLADDEFNLPDLLSRHVVVIEGKQETLWPALPPEEAQAASLDLLAAGHIRVFHHDWEQDDGSSGRYLPTDEALALLEDPATWDPHSEEGIRRAWNHELDLTESGQPLLFEAHRLFGQDQAQLWRRSADEARGT
jgi:hypothetical protein